MLLRVLLHNDQRWSGLEAAVGILRWILGRLYLEVVGSSLWHGLQHEWGGVRGEDSSHRVEAWTARSDEFYCSPTF